MFIHSTRNPVTGDGDVTTNNPITSDKTGPHPPLGINSATGQTNDGELGRNEQQYGLGGQDGTQSHNAHNPLTDGGPGNPHNPLTGDKAGPNPLSGTNPVTGRTKDDELGRDEQQYGLGGGPGPEGNQSHNTHGGGPDNTHNPLTGDKMGPDPPPGTSPVTGRTRSGELGRNEQQHGPGGGVGPEGTQSHNTHDPLTGGGPNNTHDPLTGDKTGPSPPPGANPVTGRMRSSELGRDEQQYGPGGPTGTQTHNAHNPLTGGGPNNTHDPLTGDKTGPNPPPGTNPITGRTRDSEPGRNEQQYPANAAAPGVGTTSTGYAGQPTGYAGNDTIHDTTRRAHIATGTGVGTTNTTGAHSTAPSTGGAIKTLAGKAEAAVGKFLDDPHLQAKGVQRQQRAAESKIGNTGAVHRGMDPDPTGNPTYGHGAAKDNPAAGGGRVGAGAGQTGGQAAI
ncbi:hypothetical protein FRC10_006447 [Ceratobasidium sp. 414]|nr:hypothetical protein FRC10_006447 [Ceratobasidium sp. 414]